MLANISNIYSQLDVTTLTYLLTNILTMISMFLRTFFLIFVTRLLLVSCTQDTPKVVDWIDWSEWSKKEALGDKKALVWIHSPTCDDCIEMQQNTFGHPVIINYINEHFYAAKLDIDYQEAIFAKNRTWEYIPHLLEEGKGYHQLAIALLGKKNGESISYPAIVFLDENFDTMIPITKQLTAKELELLLSFVEEEQFRNMNIEEFEKIFKSKIED